MTEEKKSQIRKAITIAQLLLLAVMIGYLIYGIVTKNSNQLVFKIIEVVVVVAYLILNDMVEPYLTEVFKNMDDFRKNAYKGYVLWDIVSMAGLLYFVLNFTENSNMLIYGGLLVYFIGSKQKRTYQGAYQGNVTKEDVEAAKKAVDMKVMEVEEVQEATEAAEE